MVKVKTPTTLKGLRERLAAMGEQLTPRVRDAARYALDHPNDVALNPVATIAKSAGIAASAFIRMAQALGFAGYSEMQGLFREPLKRGAAPSWRERIRHFGGEQPVADASDPAALLRAFSQANVMSLEHLRDDAAAQPLAAAIRLLRGAQTVHVLGLRRSYAVAAYLAYALARVGLPTVHITGLGGAIEEQAGALKPGDVLIAISFPPYAADTLKVCEQVRRTGAKRLAITDSVLSPLARDANVALHVHDAELLGFRSLTSALCMAQTLAMGIAFAERGSKAKSRWAAALADIDC